MKCPKCKADISADSHFCSKCGMPLMDTAAPGISQTKTIQKPSISTSKTLAGKYKIIKEIGRGGMGVVYKAEDTRLDRTVALKFLSSDLTQDKEAKQRFVQEAKAAAALDHPNICTVYEVDEIDGQTFIAMSFIDGQSLKEKLEAGPLKIDEAKDIALQVAEGLSEAHDKGIIHRDIKPANIMLTEKGQAKITDFGLAKLSGGADLTKASTVMGTVAYMSPEQAKGEEVDHRTDIWSLGAMFHEMLTGERPFQKSQEHALFYSILNDEPKPISEIRANVPSQIEEIVFKALEKDISKRYQTIQEFLRDLSPSIHITFPKSEKSIVVLPFDDMSPGKDNEYFSDGLTEEIISDLSSIQSLRVISRTSAMMLKGTKKSMKTIGRELNVQYVLEGSVRKAGNQLRITAQLIDALNDAHLWAEKYSGTLDDIFDIQEKVSRSIVDALKVKLDPSEDKKIAEKPIEDVWVYDLYLRARKEIVSVTEEGLERALQLIKHALSIIGDNEQIYGIMGYAYFQYFNLGFRQKESCFQKLREYTDKVFKLNPDSYIGHFLRALDHWKSGDIKEAIREYEKTLNINPNHIDSLMQISYFYTISGKPSAAMPWLDKLHEIAPLDWMTLWMISEAECEKGNFESALEPLLTCLKLYPEHPFCQLAYGHGLAFVNRLQEAYKIFGKLAKESSENWLGHFALFIQYALQNKKTKAKQAVTEALEQYARQDEFMPLWMAECFALISELDEALDWLEVGVKWGYINYPFLNELNPFLENIRDEPRFKKLMERVKHEWENFEV